MQKLTELLQSRKFWMTIAVMGAAVGLFIAGHITAEQMMDAIKWAAAFYVGALGFEDGLKKLAGALPALLPLLGWKDKI